MQHAEKIFSLFIKLKPESDISQGEIADWLVDDFGETENIEKHDLAEFIRTLLWAEKLYISIEFEHDILSIFYDCLHFVKFDYQGDSDAGIINFNDKEYKNETYTPSKENMMEIVEDINKVIREKDDKEIILLSAGGDVYELLLKPVGVELSKYDQEILSY